MIRSAFACTLLLIAATANATTDASADETFYNQKKEAETNLTTASGREYDTRLGQYIGTSPDWKPGIAKCLEANPAPQEVRGFIHFKEDGTFRLIVRPLGEFATCVANVVERMDPPRPESAPYLADFNFSTDY